MADNALAGYVLNHDAWDAWVKLPEDGKGGKLKKFKKGDKLDDVVIDSDRVEFLLGTSLPNRPMFVKSTEDVWEGENLPDSSQKSAFVAAGEMPGDNKGEKKEAAPKQPTGSTASSSK